ncbi:sigma 54-interacting transcriptional regulator [Desulfovibrio sp.]|uniref:sigma 54-interacting transcriptional regulator n=1 Tax=Desulfovibrio sp. TaxID=885 RepID=UPI00257BAA9F|nr:sigma 54-interacting transcriptional regulator [Desulfovibrio sp.]MBR2610968.1 sigma 54-interacting transcriptional regulator [Desulfovibrio sp.]
MKPIAVIAPYPELGAMFERMKSLHDIDFDIYNALCDEAIPLTQKLIDEGCKIIISRGETATMIKNQLNLRDSYILEIPITDCDRLSMLTKALEYGNRIAVVGFGATMNTSKFISGIISKDVFIKFYRITSASEVENICKTITDDGFRIIAGTPRAMAHAARFGAIGIPLLTEFSTVESVFSDAIKLMEIFDTKEIVQKAPEEIYKVNSIVFDFNNNIISDTIKIDSASKKKIIANARLVKKGMNSYGTIRTASGKLHYIINYVGNTEKNVASCCYVSEDNRAPSVARLNTFTFDGFVTNSPRLKETIAYMKGVAASNSTLIIYGDTGTGKSVLAAAIHDASPRRDKPFISFNCATIPETLIESELFGYYGGAFTGANKKGKKGYFELAHGGTIFLDEVNELSQSAQTKILKFLEDRTFIPIGSEESVSVDVRVICATNSRLRQLMEQGAFRKDLYYRLSMFEFIIPPLRERPEDIVPIASKFVAEFNRVHQHNFRLTPALIRRLRDHDYPGNVRQLRNVIERLVVISKLGMPLDFAFRVPDQQTRPPQQEAKDMLMELRLVERQHIARVLELAGHNKDKAARMLGISKSTLWRKCHEMQLGQENPA